MGYVIAKYAVRPEGVETDLNAIKGEIEQMEHFRAAEIEPLAFGMNQIIAIFRINDKVENTGVDQVEEKLRAISGVESVEMLEMGLE
jgi:translation elongation factor aEF-1 beta